MQRMTLIWIAQSQGMSPLTSEDTFLNLMRSDRQNERFYSRNWYPLLYSDKLLPVQVAVSWCKMIMEFANNIPIRAYFHCSVVVDFLQQTALMRSNRMYFIGLIHILTELVRKTYKVKEKWSHEYDKNLAQLVLIKYRSSLSNKPKPLPKVPISGTLDEYAAFFAHMVQLVSRVRGHWSFSF